jgi:predicted enzyme related to lactoylglutathione lyase
MSQRNKETIKDYVKWFEIPVLDIKRAVGFYNFIYQIDMEVIKNQQHSTAYFPANGGVGGSLIEGPGCVPTEGGTLIYLSGGKDLNSILGRVEQAGGRVVMEKTEINKNAGFFALFIDTEGNKLALHSKK